MKDNEQAFLAQMAIGWFSMDENGHIWRHMHLNGSRTGGPSTPKRKSAPTRAETTAHKKGHLKLQFSVNGSRKWVYAHRIVWMVANSATIPEGIEVNHKDGSPENNHPLNLELVTHQGNAHHSMGALGNRPPGAKMSPDQVLAIRRLFDRRTMTQRQIADMFGITPRAVQLMCPVSFMP